MPDTPLPLELISGLSELERRQAAIWREGVPTPDAEQVVFLLDLRRDWQVFLQLPNTVGQQWVQIPVESYDEDSDHPADNWPEASAAEYLEYVFAHPERFPLCDDVDHLIARTGGVCRSTPAAIRALETGTADCSITCDRTTSTCLLRRMLGRKTNALLLRIDQRTDRALWLTYTHDPT